MDASSRQRLEAVSSAAVPDDDISASLGSKNDSSLESSGESEDDSSMAATDSIENGKSVQAKNLKNKKASRREQLSRLSSSCPSLNVGWRPGYTSSLDVTQEEDEEIVPDSPAAKQLWQHSVYADSIPDELDEEAAEVADVKLGRNSSGGSSSSSSSDEEQRSRPAKSRTFSREDAAPAVVLREERCKVKQTGSLTKRTSSADEGLKVQPGKSGLMHRAGVANPKSRLSAVAAKSEAARPDATAGETARGAPVQRRSSFKSSMAGLHSGANHFASRLFGLDKSRSISTPAINVIVEPEPGEVDEELRLCAEEHEPSTKISTIKRRPSLFANLFSGHHNQEEAIGDRRKSEGGSRISMALSILGTHHHHKGKDGNDEAKKCQHTYLPAPAVDGSPCGACRKPAEGKQAVQCSGCLVIVHDSCKSKPGIPCVIPSKAVQRKAHSLVPPARLPMSSAPSRQPPLPRYPIVAGSTKLAPARRSNLSSSSSSAPQDRPFIMLTPEGSMISTVSGSGESSVEDAASSEDRETDADLLPLKPEPDCWSDTMDKKAIKKLTAKYIQRQDCIWEFIGSERQYVHTLKIAQRIFARGMAKLCHLSRDAIERLFPGLDGLVEMHAAFLERLQRRQSERADRSVDVVGDIVLEQFGGYLGARVKATYGTFVSRQREASDCYKELLRTNHKFEAFVKKSTINPSVGHHTIPDIMTIITQRMQKYRAHLDQLVRNSKESRDKFDKENLTKATECVKRIIDHIDDAIELRKKELRLIDIYTRTDVRSVAAFNGTSIFRKSDLLSNRRRLLFEGIVSCKNAREKETDVLLLLLSDVVVFLQENGQKFSFFPPDSKSLVLPLDDLALREKGSSKDSRTFSISRRSVQLNDSGRGDVLELSCKTPAEKREWTERLSKASHRCESNHRTSDEMAADDELDATASSSCKAIEQLARVNELIERLHVKEEEVNTLCCEHLQACRELQVEYGRVDEQGNIDYYISTKYGEDNEFAQAVDLIRAAHVEVLRLASAYLAYPFTVSPPSVGAGPGDHMLPASQVAANSQQRASIASALQPPGSPLGHESFFGPFSRSKRLGRSVEDVRNIGRGSVDSDSDGMAAAASSGGASRPTSATKPQWIRKWPKESGQGDGHPEQQSAVASTLTQQQRRRRSRTGRAASLMASVTRSLSLRDGKKPAVASTAAQLTVPGFAASSSSSSSKPSGAVSPSTAVAWSTVEAASAIAASGTAAAHPGQPQLGSYGTSAAQARTSASHLSEHLQAILLITNNQDSTISRYKQLATEFNVKVRELNQELEKASQEKNAFPHNKQLEEVRSIQEQITAERQRWEAEKSEVQQRNEDERLRFEQLKRDLELQWEALARERVELLQQQQQQPTVTGQEWLLRQEPVTSAPPSASAASGHKPEIDGACTAALNDLDSAAIALGRSLQPPTDSKGAAASEAAAVAAGGSTGGSRLPNWSSPLAQQRGSKTKAASLATPTKMAATDVIASGGPHAGRDKKRTQTKR